MATYSVTIAVTRTTYYTTRVKAVSPKHACEKADAAWPDMDPGDMIDEVTESVEAVHAAPASAPIQPSAIATRIAACQSRRV